MMEYTDQFWIGTDTKNHRLRKLGRRSSKFIRTQSECFDIKHLTVTVVTARRASDVRWHFTATFRAAFEDRCTPAIGATAHFLTAFGLATLWNSHGLEISLKFVLEVIES